jgi:MFS family permease
MNTEAFPPKPVPLWQNREYLLLWLRQAVSSLGTRLPQFAFPLMMVGLTHSIAAAGLAYGLEQLPYALFSLPAGALVDRWPRKCVLIICTLCLLLCVASIPLTLLLASGQLRLLQLYGIAFSLGTISLFYELAALAWVVPKAQLTKAVAQNEFVHSSCALLGPALGSLLFSLARLLPFIADAVSYKVLLGSLLNIRSPMQDKGSAQHRHLLVEVRKGLRWLWSQKVMRSVVLISSYLTFVMTASVLVVLTIVQQLHITHVLYGLIIAAGGIGNSLGTALCPPFQRRMRFGTALGSTLVVFVLFWPLFGIVTTPLQLGAVFAGIAIFDSISAILMSSYRLSVVPNALQGRVSGIYRLMLFSILTIGPSAIGLRLEHLGVLPTVSMVWSGLLLQAGFMLANRQMLQATLPHNVA